MRPPGVRASHAGHIGGHIACAGMLTMQGVLWKDFEGKTSFRACSSKSLAGTYGWRQSRPAGFLFVKDSGSRRDDEIMPVATANKQGVRQTPR